MKIEIVQRNYVAKDKLTDLINKKLSRFEKYLDDNASAKVVLSKAGNTERYKMEVTIRAVGVFVRSEVLSDNMYANLDTCLAKLERQIVRISDKAKSSVKVDPSTLLFFDEVPEETHAQIVKRKEFELDELTEDEAIEQIEVLDNDFYIYKDRKTQLVCVLYKRADGDYGLIQTR